MREIGWRSGLADLFSISRPTIYRTIGRSADMPAAPYDRSPSCLSDRSELTMRSA